MISELKSLVDPLGETEFLALLRERKLAFLPGGDSRRFETLLTWETLNHLLDSATLPLDALRVVRESIRFRRISTSSRAVWMPPASPNSWMGASV